MSRRQEIQLLPVDHNPQIGAQLEKKVPMVKKKLPQLRNHQPVVQVTEEMQAPPMCPLRNQSDDSGEHLLKHNARNW